MDRERVSLYDTTLRDGMQMEGISLSVSEQLRVAHRIGALGVDVIEAGFPASNPKDAEIFRRLEADPPPHALIAAFGMTRRRDLAPQDDPALQVIADCFAPIATIVGKTWDLHLEKVVKVSRDENLVLIDETVAWLRAQGKRVIYDAEHFFDAYRQDRDYAVRCLRVAVEAGAECVTLCDTNGATLPGGIATATADIVRELGAHAVVAIHTHNDAECGVANALAAVEVGARQVQGTINGIGERCGNANLVSILAGLQLKLGHPCVSDAQLAQLTSIAHEIAELCNTAPDPHAAYVGRSAFAHKGGMHVAGVHADPATFEHIQPHVVGNQRGTVVSEQSGRGTIRDKAAVIGVAIDDAAAARVLDRVKVLEHQGYAFEAADASFELLLRQESGEIGPLFVLESLRVITERRADGAIETEATIKLRVNGERVVQTAEGNGPVNALDGALRAALRHHYPELDRLELTNYKVRILDSHTGTGATTRVILDTSDGHDEWATVGVSPNIIEASWLALVESLTYGVRLRLDRRLGARPAAPAGV